MFILYKDYTSIKKKNEKKLLVIKNFQKLSIIEKEF